MININQPVKRSHRSISAHIRGVRDILSDEFFGIDVTYHGLDIEYIYSQLRPILVDLDEESDLSTGVIK